VVDYLIASSPQGRAGMLSRADRYLFQYDGQASRPAEISLGMPFRALQYHSSRLFPIFQMNLPEGFVLERLRARFAKTSHLDPMMLLALTSSNAGIGRVRLSLPESQERVVQTVTLADLLAHEGSESLFEQLTQDYLLRTGISGVQPKLLVPEQVDPLYYQASLNTPELIVKASGPGFSGLPINEFVCMSIAREAGIPVAEFHLSNDLNRFVMRRFDRDAQGLPLGFEDAAVLMGLDAESKYDSSYENVATVLEAYCEPRHRAASLAQLFDQVALSCMVGNGDAHLKNFGVLYGDPQSQDVRMSPAYDIVCTTCYLPDDTLALSLNRNRSLFTARLDLERFGREQCRLDDPKARLARLLASMEAILYEHAELIAKVPTLGAELTRRMQQVARLVE